MSCLQQPCSAIANPSLWVLLGSPSLSYLVFLFSCCLPPSPPLLPFPKNLAFSSLQESPYFGHGINSTFSQWITESDANVCHAVVQQLIWTRVGLLNYKSWPTNSVDLLNSELLKMVKETVFPSPLPSPSCLFVQGPSNTLYHTCLIFGLFDTPCYLFVSSTFNATHSIYKVSTKPNLQGEGAIKLTS